MIFKQSNTRIDLSKVTFIEDVTNRVIEHIGLNGFATCHKIPDESVSAGIILSFDNGSTLGLYGKEADDFLEQYDNYKENQND